MSWKILVPASCVLLFLLLLLKPGEETVQQYVAGEQQKLEQWLNTKGNDFGAHLEKVHVTVTYKGGHVRAISAKTIDGSNNAGKGGSNISELDVVVTGYWSGMLQKDGYTEMEFVFDKRANTLKSSTYVGSNAMFNSDTVDWFKVGWTIGSLLAI